MKTCRLPLLSIALVLLACTPTTSDDAEPAESADAVSSACNASMCANPVVLNRPALFQWNEQDACLTSPAITTDEICAYTCSQLDIASEYALKCAQDASGALWVVRYQGYLGLNEAAWTDVTSSAACQAIAAQQQEVRADHSVDLPHCP